MDHFARTLEQIRRNEAGESVDFNFSSLDILCTKNLADALTLSTTLHSLLLDSCGIGIEGAVALAAVLPRCPALRVLHLDNNFIGDTAALAVGTALEDPSTGLTELSLSRCGLTAFGAEGISKGLSKSRCLLTLALGDTDNIADVGFCALGAALATNVALTQLSLTYCGGGAEGVAELCRGLRKHKSLLILTLDGNNLVGDEGARHLGVFLAATSSLADLSLFGCGIKAQGAVHLAEGLVSDCTLEILALGRNPIGDLGFGAIASSLASSARKALRSLDVRQCDIGAGGASTFVHSINFNTTLQTLNLCCNDGIGDAGVLTLSSGLAGHAIVPNRAPPWHLQSGATGSSSSRAASQDQPVALKSLSSQ
jgi:Ran GTPase-activating protein (RanGAP) involved in mRNA processing and transport